MRQWTILGRAFLAPPAPDWREQLAARLGHKPRRIGRWAELALAGALACVDDAGEDSLPEGARLTLCSAHGPDAALRTALAEARDDLPLPIGFLQSQPSQVLAVLAQHLRWRGDGRCLATRAAGDALALACAGAGDAGVLAGWVDEAGGGSSVWLRLVAAPDAELPARRATLAMLADPTLRRLAILPGGELRA